MKISDIGKYIDLYYTEKQLFEFTGPRVRERGYFLFEEFYQICIWKSPRPKQRYLENEDTIEEKSREAFAHEDEGQKMEALCELNGVSIPMASALLAVVYPEKYAVIDIRCLETLRKKKCDIDKNISLKVWLRYIDIMREWAKENGVTPRDLDRALFAMHLENQGYENLYKNQPKT